MIKTKKIIFLNTIILLTLLSGCTSREKLPIACFKGNTTCFTQNNSETKNSCVDCVATFQFTKKSVETTENSPLNILNNHSI